MPKKARTRKIQIVEKKLGRSKALGMWVGDENGGNTVIELDERLTGFQRMMIIVHEAMHEICPEWEEEKVRKQSEILASILWKCDYRHVDHEGDGVPNYSNFQPREKTKTLITSHGSNSSTHIREEKKNKRKLRNTSSD